MPRLSVQERNDEAAMLRLAAVPGRTEHLRTRQDVEQQHEKKLRKDTLKTHKRLIRSFRLFLSRVMDVDPATYLLQHDAIPPLAPLLKRFALFRAQSGIGKVSAKLSV